MARLDRPARSTRDLLDMLDTFAKAPGPQALSHALTRHASGHAPPPPYLSRFARSRQGRDA
ncbi:hypothetical protein [Methylosinus sporium]|uniref:hypothetical protein n=1 Tax=Methylosinus sporium TaxID=428 RepID=UPI001FCEE06C